MRDRIEEAFEVDGYDQLEVFAERRHSSEVSVAEGEIEAQESEDSRGIGVRALRDGTVGFAYTTRPDRIRRTAERAVDLARLSQFRTISFPIGSDDTGYPEELGEIRADRVENMEQPELTEMVSDALEETYFSSGGYTATAGRTWLVNSNGVDRSVAETLTSGYLTATEEGLSRYWFDAARDVLDPRDIAAKAHDLLERSRDPTTIEAGEYDVVLTPYAQYQLFDQLLFPAFDADRVQRGKSVLEDRMDEQVAAETFSLVDDGTLEGGLRTRGFDREGTPHQRTPLIDDGQLLSFLYDVQRAEKKGIASTGNASGGYSETPHIEPTNMVVEGETGQRPDDCVRIHSFAGVHTAEPTSGDFTLNVTTGFRRDQEGERAVEQAMLSSNIFDLLESFSHMYGDRRTIDSLTTRSAVFRDLEIVT